MAALAAMVLATSCMQTAPDFDRGGARGKAEDDDLVLWVGGWQRFHVTAALSDRPEKVPLAEVVCRTPPCFVTYDLNFGFDAVTGTPTDDARLCWSIDGGSDCFEVDSRGDVNEVAGELELDRSATLRAVINYRQSRLDGIEEATLVWNGRCQAESALIETLDQDNQEEGDPDNDDDPEGDDPAGNERCVEPEQPCGHGERCALLCVCATEANTYYPRRVARSCSTDPGPCPAPEDACPAACAEQRPNGEWTYGEVSCPADTSREPGERCELGDKCRKVSCECECWPASDPDWIDETSTNVTRGECVDTASCPTAEEVCPDACASSDPDNRGCRWRIDED